MKNPKPIHVLFDANPLAQPKSGVGYYTHQLIEALAMEFPDNLELHGHYYDFLGRKKNLDLPQGPNIHYHTTRLVPGKVFNLLRRKLRVGVPLEILARTRADVLLFPNFALSPSLFRKPRIVAIHDIYFTRHPEHINAKNLAFLKLAVPDAVKNADKILAISEFTKHEIQDVYGTSPDRMIITPIPIRDSMKMNVPEARKILERFDVTGDYYLFLGTLEPRKNVETLVKAYRLLSPAIQSTTALVLAGGKGWNDKAIVRSINEAREDGLRVVTTGYISEEERRALYSAAKAVAIPSHYEGFGMQLLEAMSAEVPIIASDIPVFREVAGDACLYFNHRDPQSIADAMSEIVADSSLRQVLVEKEKVRLDAYTWSKVATDVYEVMKELTHG